MTAPATSAINPKRHIVDRVQAIIAEEGCDVPTAVDRVAEEMKLRPDFWINSLGTFLIIRVLSEQTGAGRPHLVANGKPNPSKKSLAGSSIGSIWDLITPVGNTGIRKRYGDLTEDDRKVIANTYRRLGETCMRKAKQWDSIKGVLNPGETLEQAHDRLPGLFVRFLKSEVGIKDDGSDVHHLARESVMLRRCRSCDQLTSRDAIRCEHCGSVLQ